MLGISVRPYHGLIVILGLLPYTHSMALPVDVFSPGFVIGLEHETVNDKVDYSPNLAEGGFAIPVEKPRFQSNGFALTYSTSHNTQYQFGLSQRQLNSLRDSFTINGINAGVVQRFQSWQRPRYSLDIGLVGSVNMASEIYKNSYTSYSDNLITEVRLIEPRDARLTLHADLSVALTDRSHLMVAVSGGLSQTSQKEVVGVARLDNNCQYEFSASERGGSVSQLERCGELVSYEQSYPDSKSVDDNLGFSVADDLSYRDYFLGPQLSLHWQAGSWSVSTGYQFRQYYRPTLDHRIREAGNTPVTMSHAAFANASISIMKNWQLLGLIRYQQAAFLDDIPFLYSALTHDRYSGKGVIRYGLTLSRFFN